MEPIFKAVLAGEAAVRRILRDDPASVSVRATRERLVTSIPHQLYSGDTGLHLAAADAVGQTPLDATRNEAILKTLSSPQTGRR